MRIIYMGTPAIAAGPLKALKAAQEEIVLVITQPDKPNSRRGKQSIPSPVKAAATELGLDIYQPQSASSQEAIDVMKQYNADIIVVCAYGQLLSQKVLSLTQYGAINIHASLLPAYRGAAPIARAIMNGEKESGVTIMKMDAGLDTGDMLLKKAVPIDEELNAGELSDMLSVIGAQALIEALELIRCGKAVFEKQDGAKSTYAEKIRKEELYISFEQSSKKLHDFVRALYPATPAKASINGKSISILKTGYTDEKAPLSEGSVLSYDKNGIRVCCKSGILIIKNVKPEGKQEMRAYDFINGIQDKTNLRFV